MGHRVIVDTTGLKWEVWEVHPTLAERRALEERRAAGRSTADRRKNVQQRPMVAEELQHGWLAFKSRSERRRRAPIPDNWETMSDAHLLAVLAHAQRTPPSGRLSE